MNCKYSGFSSFLMLLGRICFSLLFIAAGYQKLIGIGATAVAMSNLGVPLAGFLVFVVMFLELVGGLMVLLGWYARTGAFFIFIVVLPDTYFFHGFWAFVNPAITSDFFLHFMKNLAILGGAIYIMATGAGHLSIDGLCRKICSDKK